MQAALPKKVQLKKTVNLQLMLNGTPVGKIEAKPGTWVNLLERTSEGLKVSLNGAEGFVAEADTNFKELHDSQPASESRPDEPDLSNPSDPPTNKEIGQKEKKDDQEQVELDPVKLDVTAKKRPGAYETANFRLWHPNPKTPTRAMLVLVPGANGDGRGMANDPNWQDLAERHQMGIVACHFSGGGYQDPAAGTGDALDDAIDELAEAIGQKDLSDLPLVMWGHSAGGQFNFNYVQWKPKRVLTFVVNKGAYYTDRREKKSRSVPGLFFIGMKDSELRIKNISSIYFEGRKRGALWGLTREPNEGHGVGQSLRLARMYYEDIIPLRLPKGSEDLVELDSEEGWLGHIEEKTVESSSTANWSDKETAWLPNERLAKAWRDIVR